MRSRLSRGRNDEDGKSAMDSSGHLTWVGDLVLYYMYCRYLFGDGPDDLRYPYTQNSALRIDN